MDTNRQIPQYNQDTNQQQQRQAPGLTRYRSAPSSYFADLINSSGTLGNDVVENCDEFIDPGQTSPETERILSRLLSSSGGGGSGQSASVNEALQPPQFPTESVKHGGGEVFGLGDQHRQQQNSNYSSGSNMMYHDSVASNSGIESAYRMESLPQMKIGGGGNSHLIRHSSSPAGLFSNINVENGNLCLLLLYIYFLSTFIICIAA